MKNGSTDNTEAMVLALSMFDPNLIPRTAYSPQSLEGKAVIFNFMFVLGAHLTARGNFLIMNLGLSFG